MRNALVAAAALSGAVLLSAPAGGCCAFGSGVLVEVDGAGQWQPPAGWRAGLLADWKAHLERCESAAAPPAPGEFSILSLSWGGSFGAWGAGFTEGWRDSGSPPPRFRVVTGISTGALMATGMFLGGEFDRGIVRDAYTLTVDGDIYRARLPWELGCLSSVYTAAPLVRTVRRGITDSVIDRVAEEGRKGRKLLVGTVDTNRGEFRVWDLTAVAMSTSPQRHEHYRAILIASAAIPGFFEPVLIDGHLHSDGGMGERLLPDDLFYAEMGAAAEPVRQRLTARLKAAESAGDAAAAKLARARLDAVAPAAYAVLNTPIHTPPVRTQPVLTQIGFRGLNVLLFSKASAELRRIAAVFRRYGWGDSFRATYVPRGVPLGGMSFEEFIPAQMQRLYNVGYDYGRERRWDPLTGGEPMEKPEAPAEKAEG